MKLNNDESLCRQPPFVKIPSNNQQMQDESKFFLHAIFSNRPPKYYNNVFFSQIAHKSIHLAQSIEICISGRVITRSGTNLETL